MTTIRIQAEITGYAGNPVNLLGALDTESGLFIIAKELKFGERMDGAVVVANDPRSERRDTLFAEDRLPDAIRVFFRAHSTGMLELHAAVAKHNPEHKIESDGLSESGTKYRLGADVSNGAIAVLALAHTAERTYAAQSATDFASELADLFASI